MSHLVPLNLNILFSRETHQINNASGRPVNVFSRRYKAGEKRSKSLRDLFAQPKNRRNFVNEENLKRKLCGTRNSESLQRSNLVDQLGEIMPLVDLEKLRADEYERYINKNEQTLLC